MKLKCLALLSCVVNISCAAIVIETSGTVGRRTDEIGILSIAPPIQLTAVDGRQLSQRGTRFVEDDSHRIRFLPGPHTVAVHLADPMDLEKRAALQKGPWEAYERTENTHLSFDVHANRLYRVYYTITSEGVALSVEEDHKSDIR